MLRLLPAGTCRKIVLSLCASSILGCNAKVDVQLRKSEVAAADSGDLTITSAGPSADGSQLLLTWSGGPAQAQYQIVIGADAACETPIVSVVVHDNSARISSLNGKTLFACVYALDASGKTLAKARNNGLPVQNHGEAANSPGAVAAGSSGSGSQSTGSVSSENSAAEASATGSGSGVTGSGSSAAPAIVATPPMPGGNGIVTVAPISAQSVELTWTSAQDDATPDADLLYSIYVSSSDNLRSSAAALAHGTLKNTPTRGISSATLTGLSGTAVYYATVIVTNAAGKQAIYGTKRFKTADAWWDRAWRHRLRVTIDNSAQAEDLHDFPLLLKLDATKLDLTAFRPGGADLRVVAADNTQILAHEISVWDRSGVSQIWAKIPLIHASSADDYVWIYFDNATAADAQQKAAVWSDNFVGVWHMLGNLNDSTVNGRAGTNSNAIAAGAAGYQFNGTSSYVSVPALALTSDTVTASLVFDGSWTGAYTGLLTDRSNNGFLLGLNYNGGNSSPGYQWGNDSNTWTWNSGLTVPNAPSYLALVVDPAAATIDLGPLSGALTSATRTAAHPSHTFAGPLIFGWDSFAADRYFRGNLREIRLASAARSPAWRAADRNSTAGSMAGLAAARADGLDASMPPLTAAPNAANDGRVTLGMAAIAADHAFDRIVLYRRVGSLAPQCDDAGLTKVGEITNVASAWTLSDNSGDASGPIGFMFSYVACAYDDNGRLGGVSAATTPARTDPLLICTGGDLQSRCEFDRHVDLPAATSITSALDFVLKPSAALASPGRIALATSGNFTMESGASIAASASLAANNLSIAAGASINADGLGFAPGQGAGTGVCNSGGGHGGAGGPSNCGAGGAEYGDALHPTTFGSGAGGAGGGAIKLTATGTLTLNGTLSANGVPANGGGGAGGSIWIAGAALSGSGAVSARGGRGGSVWFMDGGTGGGGGGRIALYAPARFLGTLSVGGGPLSTAAALAGDRGGLPGTIYLDAWEATFCDSGTLNDTCTISSLRTLGRGTTLGGSGRVVIANGGWLQSDGAIAFAMTGDVEVQTGGKLAADVSSFVASGLTVAAGATFTGNVATASIASVSISGTVTGNWDDISVGDFSVAAGGKLSADGRGYFMGQGPGAGGSTNAWYLGGSGGSYGGLGGRRDVINGVGPVYGDKLAPVDWGSGGGYGCYADASTAGPSGGGRIHVAAASSITINGQLSANGIVGSNTIYASAGGSGGSIWLQSTGLNGSGSIAANGGDGSGYYYSGGGGGGRVALEFTAGNFSGTATASPGLDGHADSGDGQAGTVCTNGAGC